MRRLASYPRTRITLSHKYRDGNGNVFAEGDEDVDVVFMDEVRHVTVNGSDFYCQSWLLMEVPPSNEFMTVKKGGREFTIGGYLEFKEYELLHYQVFLR